VTVPAYQTYTDPYGGSLRESRVSRDNTGPAEAVKIPRNGAISGLRIGGHRIWRSPGAVDFCDVLLQGPTLSGAACAGTDAYLWDDRLDQSPPETAQARDERHQRAIETCRGCPVRARCLQNRLTNPAFARDRGVFGGQVFDTTAGRKCPCGEPLPEDASPQRRWCSQKCWKATRKAPVVERRCDHCGNQFTTNQDKQRFCNRTCRDRYRGCRATRPHLPGLTHCQGCGAPIPPAQTAIGRRNCSKNCRKRAAERRQQVAA
jgi:hypothetical protein